MDNTRLTAINQVIYQRFPELKGVKPRIQQQAHNTLLTYQAKITLADQKTLQRNIRVVVNNHGEITKISSSR